MDPEAVEENEEPIEAVDTKQASEIGVVHEVEAEEEERGPSYGSKRYSIVDQVLH